MLTDWHIEIRKIWAEVHLWDNWCQTIFTDETAFDLFRNKVRRWHKDGEKRMPKNIEELKKFMVEEWDAISDETVNNLVLSMENRCKLVLKENGDRISY